MLPDHQKPNWLICLTNWKYKLLSPFQGFYFVILKMLSPNIWLCPKRWKTDVRFWQSDISR
jgi:hypothetical protein